MAIFKCKMCGGNLEVAEGSSVGICEYCGTKQTIPTAKDENLQGLYNRANTLRIKSEFDKAEQLYEKILQVDGNQAEAYWGLILCKYGIEYVEDPATFKRIPTCHRASYDSIIADDDYKSAIKYADGSQRNIYEQEAKEIDRIQKEIIELSSKEEPYDVFICYKETDNTGSRTQDSVIANDIYYQLTQEGFKVFYAAITLEDKLGSAYEPCIFAALNSAKVMLAIGTKPEYFNAVWVKNEWSRYLKIMKKDRSKLLIPCYKNMDAYDLPDEFAHLQAQDMGKIGFINDVIRGIKKVVSRENSKSTPVVNVVNNTTTEPLLKRAFIFLEDGDWVSANEYCEKVLDIDPECAKAYLGKLMAELHIKKQEYLRNLDKSFESNPNYVKIIRYADDKLRNELIEYIDIINAKAEEIRKNNIFSEAKSKMVGKNIADYKCAIQLLESIAGWKDTDEKIAFCKQKVEELRMQEEREQKEREIQCEEAEKQAKKKRKIVGITMAAICIVTSVVVLLITVIIPITKYNKAITLLKEEQFEEAASLFASLGDYKDSQEQAVKARTTYLKDFGFTVIENKYVTFGIYEQDNNSNKKEDIEWIPIAMQHNKVLLVSRYALDYQNYGWDVSWKNTPVRSWLNSKFLETSFSEVQRKVICATENQNPEGDFTKGHFTNKYDFKITNNEASTTDYVFLLSAPEVLEYFGNHPDRYTKATDYAKSKGAYVGDNGNTWWGLRSPDALFVGSESGFGSTASFAIRPAMWIDLSKIS